MPTLVIKDKEHLKGVIMALEGKDKFPFTVKITDGAPRSLKQNRLYHAWFNELASQDDNMDASEYEGHTKAFVGVKMMMAEDLEYKEYIERFFKDRSYTIEEKIKMLQPPFGLPVSSLMTTKQFTRYLEEVHLYWAKKGFVLTFPDENT